MIRRLTIPWPRPVASVSERDELRLLAVSDERERAFGDERNRAALAPVDAILGCGDLEPDYLEFLGDAFRAPLLYVRGNHDRGGAWEAAQPAVPAPLAGDFEQIGGITIAGLSWPSPLGERAERDEMAAWLQVLKLAARARLRAPPPQIILSHVPPRGLGDTPVDPYHTGFAAYHWLCRSLRPVLWLHGHTTIAAAEHWRTQFDDTTLINVTGAALLRIPAVPSTDRVGAGRPLGEFRLMGRDDSR